MKFNIEYHELVVKEDIAKLPNKDKKQIKKAIQEKLKTQPEVFGKPLRKSLKNYRSLRVSDYRVIFRIENYLVKIFIIQHRSVVYNKAIKRILK